MRRAGGALIGQLAFVVPMFVGADNGERVRRVSEVAVLEPLGAVATTATPSRAGIADTDTYDILSTPAQINAAARRLGMEEDDFLDALGKRQQFLEDAVGGERARRWTTCRCAHSGSWGMRSWRTTMRTRTDEDMHDLGKLSRTERSSF